MATFPGPLPPLTRLLEALGLGARIKARRKRAHPPDPGPGFEHAQGPDGSIAQDVARTGAALLVWALEGTPADAPQVQAARAWLESQPDALAELALRAARSPGPPDPRCTALCIRGPEGRRLAALLR